MYNGNVADRLVEALNGCTTLVILLDEIHPTLDASTQENAMRAAGRERGDYAASTRACGSSTRRPPRRACSTSSSNGAWRVGQQLLDASDGANGGRSISRGGSSKSTSRAIRSEAVTPTAPLRHTILQAAPYASPLQIAERRDADAGEADALVAAPPLTRPSFGAQRGRGGIVHAAKHARAESDEESCVCGVSRHNPVAKTLLKL